MTIDLSAYHYIYNASAYFAARERFGEAQRTRLAELESGTDEGEKRGSEYQRELKRLQDEANAHEFVSLLTQDTREGFEALCWGIATLATQGELRQRLLGYDPRPLLTPEMVAVALRPHQIAQAKTLVMTAIISGLKQPDEEGAEVDEVLEALQKKTRNR